MGKLLFNDLFFYVIRSKNGYMYLQMCKSGHRGCNPFSSKFLSTQLPLTNFPVQEKLTITEFSNLIWNMGLTAHGCESLFFLLVKTDQNIYNWVFPVQAGGGDRTTLCTLQTCSPWRLKMKFTRQYLTKYQNGAGQSQGWSQVLAQQQGQ